MNVADGRKALQKVEDRISQMEEIDEPTEKQEAVLEALQSLQEALEEFIAASEG